MPPDPMEMILASFDEELADDEQETPSTEEEEVDAGSVVEPPDQDDDQGDEAEQDDAGTPEVEEEDEEAEGEQDEEGDEEEQAEEEVTAEYSPDILAYLAKYGGDEKEALKAAAELARLMGRRDEEKAALLERNAQLEAALVEVQTLQTAPPLSDDQREWVEGAALSGNPTAFVQQAIQQGEFELARAVCREWAHSNPYEAMRVGQFVDAQEIAAYQAQQPRDVPVSTDDVIKALDENIPEMRAYYGQMARIVQQLGENHPLVLEARSQSSEEAVRGMIGLYEIARASTAAVTETKDEIKRREREGGDNQRRRGVVSSASNSPSPSGTPRRDRQILPGLTLEQLDTEFARS